MAMRLWNALVTSRVEHMTRRAVEIEQALRRARDELAQAVARSVEAISLSDTRCYSDDGNFRSNGKLQLPTVRLGNALMTSFVEHVARRAVEITKVLANARDERTEAFTCRIGAITTTDAC